MFRSRDLGLLVGFALSGAAGLGYELCWTHLLGLALGHEMLGVLGVLAGFFGGMALGSALLHGRARSVGNPARLFVLLETGAATFALVSPWLLYWASEHIPGWFGPIAARGGPVAMAIATAIAGTLLLPATFCMGGTLAALVEVQRAAFPEHASGQGLARLYAANVFGAVLGVLLTVHLLVPTLGIAGACLMLAALGFSSAVVVFRWSAWVGSTTADTQPATDAPPPLVDCSHDPDAELIREPWLLHLVVFATGVAGVGLEIVSIQILAQNLENTVYTFAHVLAVYLVGTAIGAWSYQRFGRRAIAGKPATVTAVLLVLHALSVVLAGVVLVATPSLQDAIAPRGSEAYSHMVAEATVALLVFMLPTVLMGALFSHLVGLIGSIGGVGRAYALNALGAAIAPFVFGLWAIEALGYRDAFYLVTYVYLATFAVFTWFRRFKPIWQISAILLVVFATGIGPNTFALVHATDGWTELERRETPMGVVIVSERSSETTLGPTPTSRRLQIGRHFRMGGAQSFGEQRMGHLPLLLAPQARDAAFLGIGTGATLGAARSFSLDHVDAVELVPAVLDMLHYFDDINGSIRDDERVTFHAADARRFVAATHRQWDIVVADLFHPAQEGAGALYTREHFSAVRARIRRGGLFAQWLPLYQLDEANLRTIVRTFLDVYEYVYGFLGIYNVQTPALVLIGHVPNEAGDQLRIDLDALERRLAEAPYPELLMNDARDVLASYMIGQTGLEALARSASSNTDLHPRVSYDTPHSAYRDSERMAYGSLVAVLRYRERIPGSMIGAQDPDRSRRFVDEVDAFTRALDHYLHGEIARVAAKGEATDEALEHYLEAYALAPAFAPSRGMLYALASKHPWVAERVLPRMLAITPADPRVHQVYLSHLRHIGDEVRYRDAFENARARFGPTGPSASLPHRPDSQ